VFFHTPPAFENNNGKAIHKKKGSSKVFTDFASEAIRAQMQRSDQVTVMTAAMCQGNKLESIRDEFPDRFFDTGICESHAVAFAAGQAKAGLRPIVDIYSTFMQRSYDQVFQEVALQNLPVVFMMDRAGLTGPDGPTHHGVFDIGYMRLFPNMVVMAPGDAHDMTQMVDLAIQHSSPCSLRYPKASARELPGNRTPVKLGKAEVLHWGQDGTILACGSLVTEALAASVLLRGEGLEVGVVNARFAKPIDREIIHRAIGDTGFLVTVEESMLMGGFGSAVLEVASEDGLASENIRRLGIPDQFVEHGDRDELLADLGLDAAGIARTCRMAAPTSNADHKQQHVVR
jgi:1-deoxy-D-xylulose-5-phosphate synthase